MAVTIGLTKYGFKIEYLANGSTTSKSFNYVNFSSDTASVKAAQFDQFLNGTGENDVGLYGVVDAMGSPYSINGQSLTQENAVTFT